MNDRLRVGTNIKKWRSFRGIKQQNLACTIGISRVTLSKYENGRTEISVILLSDIARALAITLDELAVA
jgi:transcriptional regulator with XRE-family HTH domain